MNLTYTLHNSVMNFSSPERTFKDFFKVKRKRGQGEGENTRIYKKGFEK